MKHAIDVRVSWGLRRSWRAAALLRKVAEHVARAEGFDHGWLSIAVVGARRMTTLHERYLGIAEPTDVLTFDLGTDRPERRIDGDVIVCADLARRRASQPKGNLSAARAELALYVTHGILHLAGYQDTHPAAHRRMHAREDELLSELGLGAVFAAASC